MKGLVRGTIQHSLAWSFCAVYLPLLILAMVLTAGRLPNVVRAMIRFWGQTMLVFCGVKLEFEGDCEALKVQKPRVFTFNHASTLDVFIITALFPPGGTAVVKREMAYIPFIGWAVYFSDFVRLDRRNRERAVASLKAAGKRIRDDALSVFIAPEGTRSGSRVPSEFKMGAFRMAEIAGVDVHPLVVDGAAEVWPTSKIYCPGGTVKVRLLEPIRHAELVERGVHAVAEDLRGRYARDLGVELPAVAVEKALEIEAA